ncbi:hypothetical protein BH11ACT8_BH11ACT8_04950 [soil metagenome]
MRHNRVLLAVPLAALLLTLTGCSVTVSQSDLEAKVAQMGPFVSVDCDGDLKGEVGATQDCVGTNDDDSTTDVVVVVSSVDGKVVTFGFQAAGG